MLVEAPVCAHADHDDWPQESWEDDEDDGEGRFRPGSIALSLGDMLEWLVSVICKYDHEGRGDQGKNAVDDEEGCWPADGMLARENVDTHHLGLGICDV